MSNKNHNELHALKDRYLERVNQIDNKLKKANALANSKKRREQTRFKIIIGSLCLKYFEMEKKEDWIKQLIFHMDKQGKINKSDREFLIKSKYLNP